MTNYPNDTNHILGINEHRVTPFRINTQWMFVDLMKHAGTGVTPAAGAPWASINLYTGQPDNRPLPTDVNGWPTGFVAGQGAACVIPSRDGGSYVCTWTGSGIVQVRGVTVTHASTNRIEFIAPANALPQVVASVAGVSNVRIVHASFDALPDIYHPLYLQRIAPFATIRMMEPGRTDEVSATGWSQRTPAAYATQAGTQFGGVAFEHMIAIANLTHANVWINIPYLANDDFVTQLATLIRDILDPTVKVYLEWGNENWNGVYQQMHYCLSQGAALGFGQAADRATGLRFQAYRSTQCMKLVAAVFGSAMTSRVVRVLGSQIGATNAHQTLLTFHDTANNHDALAIAAYFGVRWDLDPSLEQQFLSAYAMSPAAGLNWIFARLTQTEIPGVLSQIKASHDLVTQHAGNMHLIGYEGGQSFTPVPGQYQQDSRFNDTFLAANRDPRMGLVYKQLLDGWKSTCGVKSPINLYAHAYAPNAQYGYWGALEHQDQDLTTAYKYTAMTDWISANPS